MVASMTSDEIAVYKSLERAFRHLSFDDKGEMRDINPEVGFAVPERFQDSNAGHVLDA